MPNVEFDDLRNFRNCRDVFIVQSVTRIDDQTETGAIGGRRDDTLQFGGCRCGIGVRKSTGMQFYDRRAGGDRGIELARIIKVIFLYSLLHRRN